MPTSGLVPEERRHHVAGTAVVQMLGHDLAAVRAVIVWLVSVVSQLQRAVVMKVVGEPDTPAIGQQQQR